MIYLRYKRLSSPRSVEGAKTKNVSNKTVPCLLEILYAGYVAKICISISNGEWPFEMISVSDSSLKKYNLKKAVGRLGLMFEYDNVCLETTFYSLVEKIVESANQPVLDELVSLAKDLMPREPDDEASEAAPCPKKNFLVHEKN